MNKLMALLALAALPASAAAQRTEVTAAVRVSNRVEVGFRYRPEPRAAYYRGPEAYRWSGRRAAYRRPGYHWTSPRGRQAYLRALALEHDRLHYDMGFMRRGRAKHLHRWWHREVGYGHGWFVQNEVDHGRRNGPRWPHRGGGRGGNRRP